MLEKIEWILDIQIVRGFKASGPQANIVECNNTKKLAVTV